MKNFIDALISATAKDFDENGDNHPPDEIPRLRDIAFFRNRIFNLFTYFLIPVGLIALIPGVLIAIGSGTFVGYLVAGGDLLMAAFLIFVILTKSITIQLKKVVMVGTLYLLAVFLIIALGSFGPGIIYVLLLSVLMSLIFDRQIAQRAIWINLIICIILAIVIEFKLFNSPLSAMYNIGDWTAYATNLLVFSVISYLTISTLTKSLEQNIQKLSITQARQRGLLASLTNYVIRTDLNGKYTYANNKFVRDFGWLYAKNVILGNDAILSILPHHHQRLAEAVNKCLALPSEVVQVYLDKPKPDGGILTTLWEFICVKDDFGTPSEIQCVGIDVSDRIRVERELELSLEDLYKHNKELQTYAYVISHNLRAPIANILGLVSLIEEDKGDVVAMTQYSRKLKASTDSLDQVVKDLSKGVSIVGHAIESSTEEISLQDIFNSVKEDLQNLIISTKTTLSLPDESVILNSKRAYLHDIFYNLVYNAIKYKGELPPQITVNISINTQYVVITVADNGVGIDVDKHHDKLFKPYNRLNTTIPGKGLGLFFVKRQVDALGGLILVDSELNVGSTFTVVLPK